MTALSQIAGEISVKLGARVGEFTEPGRTKPTWSETWYIAFEHLLFVSITGVVICDTFHGFIVRLCHGDGPLKEIAFPTLLTHHLHRESFYTIMWLWNYISLNYSFNFFLFFFFFVCKDEAEWTCSTDRKQIILYKLCWSWPYLGRCSRQGCLSVTLTFSIGCYLLKKVLRPASQVRIWKWKNYYFNKYWLMLFLYIGYIMCIYFF